MDIFSAQRIHLTGIKGVAMTSLAQCLIDMGKEVTGSDVSEDFVTQQILNKLQIPIFGLNSSELSTLSSELLIYTAAHAGPNNPEVLLAKANNIQTLSHAEALAQLFNAKSGIAVCGVGGKSTVSAMIVWILSQMKVQPSFSVGVGNIIGLNKTGQWNSGSEYFITEADEYVIDPAQKPPVPRFSFLQPSMIVCTNLQFDHPDVYSNFEETKKAFLQFFLRIKVGGNLIINGDDENLLQLSREVTKQRDDIKITTFGTNPTNNYVISAVHFSPGFTHAQLSFENQIHQLQIPLPGEFNIKNAVGALVAVLKLNIAVIDALQQLQTFRSTQRRFEFKGNKRNIHYYDDYAHHPSEIKAVVQALHQWYPNQRCVVAFQPHTFSRTIALREDFVDALSTAPEVVLLDIFASAREKHTTEISSDHLVDDLKQKYPSISVMNLHSIENLAEFCLTQLRPNDVFITLGAGDIYKVHDMI